MHKFTKTALALIVSSMLLIGGCNDDDTDTGGGTDTGSGTDTGGGTDTGSGTDTGGIPGGSGVPGGSVKGIRNDKLLSEHQKVGANEAPYTAGVMYPDFSSVVFLETRRDSTDLDFTGSGVLISDRWILTAGHNIVTTPNTPAFKPNEIKVRIGVDPNSAAELAVERVVIHPNWSATIAAEGSAGFQTGSDVALIKLAESVTTITPAVWNQNKQEVIGSTLWVAGFGDYSGNPAQTGEYPTIHAYENVLDRIKLNVSIPGGTMTGGVLASDFDSPAGDKNTLGDNIVKSDEAFFDTASIGSGSETVSKDFEGVTVTGDSGGGVFGQIDGSWQLVGVISSGANEPLDGLKDGEYGSIDIHMRTASHKDWINSVIQ